MVFSSLPVYLDPPNWQQQDPQQRAGGGPGEINSQLPSLMPPPPAGGCSGGGPATIKPGVSMAERARIAKLPQPEASLKCPRCESTNTKFCYFNNYNLTQPRHLCKTCRRYWTRGGALRNVPVGGGCRRNKRSKFKSPNTASCSDRQSSSTSTATRSSVSSAGCSADNNMVSGSHVQLPAAYHHHQLSFFPHLHNPADFRSASDVAGLDFGQVGNEIESRMGSSFGTLNLSTRFHDQWRATQPLMPPHFPFLAGGLEQFEGGGMVDQPFGYGGSDNKTLLEAGSGAVKLEENHHQQGPNSSRNFLSVPAGNEQYWGSGNEWTDLAAPTSSATHDRS